MKQIFFHKIFISMTLLFAAAYGNTFAAWSYEVAGGATQKIDEWGVCKDVTNASGWPKVFVPTKSAAEWDEFRSHKPAHVSFADCAAIPPGVTLTIYEKTGGTTCWPDWWGPYGVGPVAVPGGLPATLNTPAGERYTFTLSEGKYIKISCWRNSTAGGPGHNIVAVKLNNMPGYPGGMWADRIISYQLGDKGGGNAATRWNALGAYYTGKSETVLGNGNSELVVGFPF